MTLRVCDVDVFRPRLSLDALEVGLLGLSRGDEELGLLNEFDEVRGTVSGDDEDEDLGGILGIEGEVLG